jgi:hypothetical protein
MQSLDALLPLSLCLITAGIVLSVHEEWAERGLTDTSYTSLWCWVAGLLGITAWGLFEHDSLLALVTLVPAGLFGYWIWLKSRGRSRRKTHRP